VSFVSYLVMIVQSTSFNNTPLSSVAFCLIQDVEISTKIPAVGVASVTSCTSSRYHYVSFGIWKRMLKRNDVGMRWNGQSVGVGRRVGGKEEERIVIEVVVVEVEAGGTGKAVVAGEGVEVVGGVVPRGAGVGRVQDRRASEGIST
jgi:hypothetical protein